jgi:foldase protein PrsA
LACKAVVLASLVPEVEIVVLMHGSSNRLLAFGAVVLGAVGLAACGGGGSESASDPAAPSDPGAIVARVGGTAITKATVDHWLAVEQQGEPVVPPEFTACVARLKEAAASGASGAATAATGTKPSAVALKGACAQQYQNLREEAIERFIVGDWVIGGARELGVDVSGPAFQRKFAAEKKRTFHTQAAYQSYLESKERTDADVKFLVHTDLDSEAIRAALKRRVGPVTAARVRSYYNQHESQYSVAEQRDLQIAETTTRAAGLAVKQRIASGESFATVVKGLRPPQPVSSSDGSVSALESGFYKEPALNDAIFAAKLGVLTGPIKTEIGYYVFEVKTIHPAHQQSLSAVAASIRQILPETLDQQELVDYIKHWRAKWTSKTDCSAGYVVAKCRQFKVSGTAAPEDPYTLN